MEIKYEKQTEKQKITLVAILVVASCFLTYYYHGLYKTGTVFTHFFYIPIILASLWWKRKGLVVAIFLAAFLILTDHFFGMTAETTINDYLRALTFIVISLLVATLSGRITKVGEKLWETDYYLESLFKYGNAPIIIWDPELKITRFNHAFERLAGYKAEEVIGQELHVLFPEANRDESLSKIKRTLSGERRELMEIPILCKDGGILLAIWNSANIYDKDGSTLLGAIAQGTDITELKQSEKVIRETKEFLENVIESSRDGILITDEMGNIISLNHALEEMTRYREEELIGKHASIFTVEDKEIRKMVIEKTAEMFEKGFCFFEAKQDTKDGRIINVECSCSMIKDDKGNYTGGVTVIRDITERKKMEQQLLQSEKLKSLGELAGGVAHDFNNCLAAILGRAQLIKMDLEAPPGMKEKRKTTLELKGSLEIIEQAARDGAETVRRIQEFARRRADDKDFTQVDINELINQSLEFTSVKWKNESEEKGIKIDIQKELSSLPSTTGCASELREVFTNLINNAIDAMPNGGHIKIKTLKKQNHISIKIEDTGIGIPKHVRDKIFDPFFTTKGPQSTGLGMSVSYGIINRHQGNIKIDSVEGQGTTFAIKLPISEKKIKEEKVDTMPEEQRKARILIIEDEEEVLNVLASILTRSGHEVEATSTGEQGIEIFEKKEFDLVFTDLGMPGMSGWQVAEKIKSINGRVPVAVITGWNIEISESEMKNKWIDLIIHKPFEVNHALRLVQEGMILRERFKAA